MAEIIAPPAIHERRRRSLLPPPSIPRYRAPQIHQTGIRPTACSERFFTVANSTSSISKTSHKAYRARKTSHLKKSLNSQRGPLPLANAVAASYEKRDDSFIEKNLAVQLNNSLNSVSGSKTNSWSKASFPRNEHPLKAYSFTEWPVLSTASGGVNNLAITDASVSEDDEKSPATSDTTASTSSSGSSGSPSPPSVSPGIGDVTEPWFPVVNEPPRQNQNYNAAVKRTPLISNRPSRGSTKVSELPSEDQVAALTGSSLVKLAGYNHAPLSLGFDVAELTGEPLYYQTDRVVPKREPRKKFERTPVVRKMHLNPGRVEKDDERVPKNGSDAESLLKPSNPWYWMKCSAHRTLSKKAKVDACLGCAQRRKRLSRKAATVSMKATDHLNVHFDDSSASSNQHAVLSDLTDLNFSVDIVYPSSAKRVSDDSVSQWPSTASHVEPKSMANRSAVLDPHEKIVRKESSNEKPSLRSGTRSKKALIIGQKQTSSPLPHVRVSQLRRQPTREVCIKQSRSKQKAGELSKVERRLDANGDITIRTSTASRDTLIKRSSPGPITPCSQSVVPCFYVPVVPLVMREANSKRTTRRADIALAKSSPYRLYLGADFYYTPSTVMSDIPRRQSACSEGSRSRLSSGSPLPFRPPQSDWIFDFASSSAMGDLPLSTLNMGGYDRGSRRHSLSSGGDDSASSVSVSSLDSDDFVADGPESPPNRSWTSIAGRTSGTAGFTVMCYNVLCDKYCTRQLYPYCPSWALTWENRKARIMQEIRYYHADIITLQEVETSQYHEFFLPELKKDGYLGIFSPKSRAKTMQEGERGHVDGCAIFYMTEKFELVKEHLIEFNQLAMANAEGSRDMLNRVMTKDNIAIAALLQTKDSAFEHGMPADYQTKHYVMVSTVHIHWDPTFKDVKLIQTMMLLSELKSILDDCCTTHSICTPPDPNAIPLILCGDLNSLPDSGVVEYLQQGKVSRKHGDFCEHGYDACLQKMTMSASEDVFTHPFRLAEAYPSDSTAFTNYTFDFKGVIDYVFYSTDHLRKTGVLLPPDVSWFEQNKVLGCPNAVIPSDHLSLLVELELNPSPRTGSQAANSSAGVIGVPGSENKVATAFEQHRYPPLSSGIDRSSALGLDRGFGYTPLGGSVGGFSHFGKGLGPFMQPRR